MGITTKIGDKGTTKTLSGEIVSKSDLRLCAIGTLDELTSTLGLARSMCKDKNLCIQIRNLQIDLIRLAAELSSSDNHNVKIELTNKKHIENIEKEIASLEAQIKLPSSLIIPGVSSVSAVIDLARSIARRMEREIVKTKEEIGCFSEEILVYTNRLSDYLFLLARYAERLEEKKFDTID